jgi:hypothetical protein
VAAPAGTEGPGDLVTATSTDARRAVHLGLLAGVLLGPVACGDGTDLVTGQAMVAASGTGGSAGPAALPAHCAGAAAPPAGLECTGLYADLATGKLAPGVREYAPAYALWSDGADKRRWIGLPAGSVIDASDPNEWVFPVGTRVWKEFAQQGIRVETRLWQKVSANFWVNAVYVWNPDQSAAPRSKGGDIPFGDGTYHVPTQEECEKCHRGRTEHILGFSAVDLGLPGARGVTLESLAAEGRLQPPPENTQLRIGDDGTGLAAPALGWLHANCGNTCHNGNSLATAFTAGMQLRLDPRELDGRPTTASASLTTTVGVAVRNVNWDGRVRIIPGNPKQSLLYDLLAQRGTGQQMPPIATRLVDAENAARIADWISRMPPGPP